MNAIQTVQAVRSAEDAIQYWSAPQAFQVNDAMPRIVRERGHSALEWAITVEVLRRPTEQPADTAQRLARYIVLHAERFDSTPTLATFRAH